MKNITLSATTMESIEALNKAVAVAENARKEGDLVNLPTYLKTAQKAVKTANKAITDDACADFVATFQKSPVDFVASYWNDWMINGLKLDVSNDGIVTDDAELRVLLSDIDRSANIKLFNNGAWRSYLRIYADNIFQYIAENKKDEYAVCTKTPLPVDLIARRNKAEKHWQKHSHSALVQQLNDLVKMIFPVDVQPNFHMVSVDQNTIITSIAKAKNLNTHNAAGLQLANIVTMEKILCTQIYTRMNNLAVNLETGFKDKQVAKPNAPKADEAKATAPVKSVPVAEKTVA